jgi:NAD+ kinase
MKKVAVIPNPLKAHAVDLVGGIVKLLKEREFVPVLEQEIAEKIGKPVLGRKESDLWEDIDLVMVLGGDGSMLNVAHRVYPREIPLLGVNLGHLGFLTSVESNTIEAALNDLAQGRYSFEERTMITAKVVRGKESREELVALNEMVVSKKSFAIVRLDTWIDREYLTAYPADGLIVATATGSTAYSLSAGGPILDPRMKALLMTPICAHSLYARPMVISEIAEIKVVPDVTGSGELSLTADGQASVTLLPGDEIYFYKARYSTKLLQLYDRGIFEALRSRLEQGRI